MIHDNVQGPLFFRGSSTASTPGLQPAQYPVPGGGVRPTSDYVGIGTDSRGATASSYASTAYNLGLIDGSVRVGFAADNNSDRYARILAIGYDGTAIQLTETLRFECTAAITDCAKTFMEVPSGGAGLGGVLIETATDTKLITLD